MAAAEEGRVEMAAAPESAGLPPQPSDTSQASAEVPVTTARASASTDGAGDVELASVGNIESAPQRVPQPPQPSAGMDGRKHATVMKLLRISGAYGIGWLVPRDMPASPLFMTVCVPFTLHAQA